MIRGPGTDQDESRPSVGEFAGAAVARGKGKGGLTQTQAEKRGAEGGGKGEGACLQAIKRHPPMSGADRTYSGSRPDNQEVEPGSNALKSGRAGFERAGTILQKGDWGLPRLGRHPVLYFLNITL